MYLFFLFVLVYTNVFAPLCVGCLRFYSYGPIYVYLSNLEVSEIDRDRLSFVFLVVHWGVCDVDRGCGRELGVKGYRF